MGGNGYRLRGCNPIDGKDVQRGVTPDGIIEILISNQLFQSTTTQLYNTYNEADETGVEPILGIMWSHADRISVGASIRKTSIINSNWGAQSITDTMVSLPQAISIQGEDKRNMPLETRRCLHPLQPPAALRRSDSLQRYRSLGPCL